MQNFGSGVAFATPLYDSSGNAIAAPTPVKLAILQDWSLDFDFGVKELYGSNAYAIDAGRGKGKITSKAKSAKIFSRSLSVLGTGLPITSGLTLIYADAVGAAIPANQTFTPTPPNSGTYAADLGVQNMAQLPLARQAVQPTVVTITGAGMGAVIQAAVNPTTGAITGFTVLEGGTGWTGTPTATITGTGTGASAPTLTVSGGAITAATGSGGGTGYGAPLATGTYYTSGGAYTYSAADVGTTVYTSYRYTQATGNTQLIINPIVGNLPTYQIEMYLVRLGKSFYVRLNNAYSSKLAMATKQDDFTIPEFDLMAMDDGTGNIGIISSTD